MVGPHEVEKVPAAEIEFPQPFGGPLPLASGLNCDYQMIGPEDAKPKPLNAVGGPLPVSVSFYNRSGMPLEFPALLVGKSAGGNVAVRQGVTMSLNWVGDIGSQDDDEDPSLAFPLPMKALPLLTGVAASKVKTLDLQQSGACDTFNLRDCFDITRPGIYRLKITFAPDSGLGQGESPVREFELR